MRLPEYSGSVQQLDIVEVKAPFFCRNLPVVGGLGIAMLGVRG
jgi:hypothetical protein